MLYALEFKKKSTKIFYFKYLNIPSQMYKSETFLYSETFVITLYHPDLLLSVF